MEHKHIAWEIFHGFDSNRTNSHIMSSGHLKLVFNVSPAILNSSTTSFQTASLSWEDTKSDIFFNCLVQRTVQILSKFMACDEGCQSIYNNQSHGSCKSCAKCPCSIH